MWKFDVVGLVFTGLIPYAAAADSVPGVKVNASLPWHLTIELPASREGGLPTHSDTGDAEETYSATDEALTSPVFSVDGQFRRHSTSDSKGAAFVENYLNQEATTCELDNLLKIAQQLKPNNNPNLNSLLAFGRDLKDPIAVEVLMQRYKAPTGHITEMYRVELKSSLIESTSQPVFADAEGCGVRQGLGSMAVLSDTRFLILTEQMRNKVARVREDSRPKSTPSAELIELRHAVSQELDLAHSADSSLR